ncbi:hypothetical protein SAMN05216573_12253 [Bradyrhizobium sp. Rc3b]|uniref:hypothetical protein n=1 Tax=Bradyrhizobium sp. Rc3b TaxID=1855322 RepID=UPI0008F0BF83|nr:hypothetical protein [Bradyrhizobium sp. Rc3b]SFN80751.1 hypothetical protein SAMN05216573_12253 [Bradyrhizobium sp. Rc3b]
MDERSPEATKENRRLTKITLVEFVCTYIATAQNPTLDGLRAHPKQQGFVGGRELYGPEYKRQMKDRLGEAIGPGRRTKIRGN